MAKWIKIGKCNNAEDISDIENINRSICWILRLKRLSPNIKSHFDGNQPDGFGLCDVENHSRYYGMTKKTIWFWIW